MVVGFCDFDVVRVVEVEVSFCSVCCFDCVVDVD